MSKTGKPRVIALNGHAMALLRSIPRTGDNPYIFPSPITGRPCPSLHFPWPRIKQRACSTTSGCTTCGIRSPASSSTKACRSTWCRDLLGHTQPRTTQRYAHLAQDTLNSAAEIVANVIAGAIKLPGAPIELAAAVTAVADQAIVA